MNKKSYNFLADKLTELVNNNILSTSQYNEAMHYFSGKKATHSVSTIFGGIGIFLIALSIITIFAINWSNIDKSIKIVISFVPILISSFMFYKYLTNRNTRLQLYTSIFTPIAIIATNSLIAQIFHIQTDIHELFFTSLIMFMPIAFTLRNKLSILIYSIGSIIFSFAAIEEYSSELEALFKIFITVLPLITYNFINYRHNKNDSKNIIMWIANVIIITLFLLHKELINENSILMYLYMLYFLTQTLFDKENILNKYLSTIFLIYLICSCTTPYMLEFAEEIKIEIATLILMCLSGIFIYLSKAYKNYQEYFIFAFICLIHFIGLSKDVLFILTNIIVIALGISKIIIGNSNNHYTEIKKGIALILLIVMFRFVSAELSFTTKSILFLISGTCFLLSSRVIKKKLGGNMNE